MPLRITAVIKIGLCGLVLAACVPDTGMKPQTGTAAIEGNPDQAIAVQAADVTVEQTSPPPLVYSWDTGFSAFLSPPIEVRRLARDDCMAAGYEVATVETMALDGSKATATFICRGDFE
jgi:hypothetical protein